ncbi:hypothetical protein ABT294_14890 [Nonomuraea sp. NPDC000554]|uniref:hypothetical protein n=1 Tax=Nonomuraea sp. NPDC000554 TaxID=3154259 RepID=UPI0033226624
MKITMMVAGVVAAGLLCGPAASAAPKPSITKNFLLYEEEARKDTKHAHWQVNDEITVMGDIACTKGSPKGWAAAREITYNLKNDGVEATTAERGEQVFLFADASGARKLMDQFRKRLAACGKTVRAGAPKIGDEAVSGSRASKRTKIQHPQTQQYVAVRKGAAVALYWDLHNDTKALRTLAEHEADAKKMAGKLCAIGGC